MITFARSSCCSWVKPAIRLCTIRTIRPRAKSVPPKYSGVATRSGSSRPSSHSRLANRFRSAAVWGSLRGRPMPSWPSWVWQLAHRSAKRRGPCVRGSVRSSARAPFAGMPPPALASSTARAASASALVWAKTKSGSARSCAYASHVRSATPERTPPVRPRLKRCPRRHRPAKGISAIRVTTRPGITIAPMTSVPAGKYLSHWNRNMKYHSGRAAAYGSAASAGAPSGAPPVRITR